MNEPEKPKNFITRKSIEELLGMKYVIPEYQRGYRWQPPQVKDLLNDINEFNPTKDNEFYCLQPLVVKKSEDGKSYDVIDGQQRLTTIKIILNYLKIKSFDVEYVTRKGSEGFLNAIDDSKKDKNIDYFYMSQAYDTVREWFEAKGDIFKKFSGKLLNKTKVIWYETVEKNIIDVFERLNSGKIPLTNAELIKALFLKSSNFGDVNSNELRLCQQEIAMQWDEIEYALQNDEFWYFINKTVKAGEKYKDTRIDFIFDLIFVNDLFEMDNECIRNEKLKSYRYVNEKFKKGVNQKDLKGLWKQVRDIYLTLKEWYNDIKLYHYIGFLVAESNMSIYEIYNTLYEDEENKKLQLSKSDFLEKIKDYISNIFTCKKSKKLELSEIRYKGEFSKYVKKALLLHNVETMTQQIENQESSKYKLAAFQKFPFHLYKLENWDIEHISSQTENKFNDRLEQLYFLNSAKLIVTNDGLRGDIESVLKSEENFDFNDLKNRILVSLNVENVQYYTSDGLDNLALLDSKTNRSYGNAIFPVKRQCVINKDKAKLDKSDEISSFVPICTKNVFLKYYSPLGGTLLVWTEDDAKAYFNNMKETLKDFIESE